MAKSTKERTLVIVESPTKARTVSRFLGAGFTVMASNGHVRDLPDNASEIPARFRKEAWAKLGIHIERDFAPLYVILDSKKQRIKGFERRSGVRSASTSRQTRIVKASRSVGICSRH